MKKTVSPTPIKNVLSCFDGMSCGQIALNNLGIQYENYFASEIDKFVIKVTQANFPNTIQLGDITEIKAADLPQIDLLIGGSPCQGFSFAGKGLNFEDPRSKLFFEFVRLLKELKPKYWLLENIRMKKEFEAQINQILGCKPYRFNSSLVSAQNRRRLYWTNIKVTASPKDERIMLKDIIQPLEEIDKKYLIKNSRVDISKITSVFEKNRTLRVGGRGSLTDKHHFDIIKLSRNLIEKKDQHKASCLTAGGNSGGNHSDMDVICVAMRGRSIVNGKRVDKKGSPTQQRLEFNFKGKSNCLTTVQKDNLIFCLNPKDEQFNQTQQQNRVYDIQGKSPALLSSLGGRMNVADYDQSLGDSDFVLRRLTPIEFERLQTVPDGYTNHVSNTQRYKMLGNGWTVKVVEWVFGFI
jgi:DNA (cytosine-5)-methyltransferase 3A